jgi:hypothetical protein
MMDTMFDFLPEPVKTVLVGVLAVFALLVTAANSLPDVAWLRPFRLNQNLSEAQKARMRRLPDVAWLRPFRLNQNLSEAQKARMRRRARLHVGLELIGVGLLLPVGYLVLTVMMFNEIDPLTMGLTLAGSVVCIGLGIWAMFSSK